MELEPDKMGLSEEEIIFLYRLFKNIEMGFNIPICEIAGYNILANDTVRDLKKRVYRYVHSKGSEWMRGKGCRYW